MFDYNSYHFIGIGGIGISAIARMLKMRGKKVTGSDNSESEITEDLKKLGIPVSIGHRAKNMPADAEEVIYTIAIKEDNPELAEAKGRGLLCVTYPEALGELSKKMFTIAVSGTHGKTTVTAMIGHILKKAGLDPTIIVGSKILGENTNFIAGQNNLLVVEACEYKRSFLNLYPKILVITNIDADHLDYYKDLDDIKSAFQELAQRVLKDGQVIRDSDYQKVIKDFHLLLPGAHNILNAQAAIKTVEAVGISNEQAKAFLKDFKGAWRRLEYKGVKNSHVVYDDYAHHPTEIRASLLALKEKHPNRELICVFEPHQQGRTKLMFDDFVESLKLADRVFIAPIFTAREQADYSISNKILVKAINSRTPADWVNNPAELKKKLAQIQKNKPFCLVLMGAGDIYKWTNKVIEFL